MRAAHEHHPARRQFSRIRSGCGFTGQKSMFGRDVAVNEIVRLVVLALCGLWSAHPVSAGWRAAEDPAPTQPAAPTASPAQTWFEDYSEALRDALVHKRPILLQAGSDSCTWCARLETEMAKPEVQAALAQWTLLHIDADQLGPEQAKWNVGAVPALRALSMRGTLLKSHNGFLEAEELVSWLKENYDEADKTPDEMLMSDSEPSLAEVVRLVRLCEARDATLREAAIRRLAPFPQVASGSVARAFRDGSLASRLAMYEILRQWQAPLAGLDPWQEDTFTSERLASLDEWLKTSVTTAAPPASTSYTEENRQTLLAEIPRLLQANEDEAAAIIERLSHFGKAALPDVVAILSDVSSDQERRRLLTLRYRLVAGNLLPLIWPGGLERLADSDPQVRHKAAEELATTASEQDQELLLELFSDPDPLVRELSLHGLRGLGGEKASAALVALLQDPEPNIRAAVLKQLSEDTPDDLVEPIAEYVKQETDPDLIVHAIRYLRQSKSKKAAPCLTTLLDHESWQVRAEAAESMSAVIEAMTNSIDSDDSTDAIPDLYDALLKRLDDSDAFVVNRALSALTEVNIERAVEPLVRTAVRHRELATQAVAILAHGSQMREKAIPHLREFLTSDDASLRAAAVTGLTAFDAEDLPEVLQAALTDQDSAVRAAAAAAILHVFEKIKRPQDERNIPGISGIGPDFSAISRRVTQATPSEPTATTDSTDVAEEGTEGTDELADSDAWLTELYAGKHRKVWLDQVVEPLRAMLSASDATERHAAAMALLPYGRASEALPVLIALLHEDPEWITKTTKSQAWVLWPERKVLFEEMMHVARNGTEQVEVVSALGSVADPRTPELLWSIMERDDVSKELLSIIHLTLQQLYFGHAYYDRSRLTAGLSKRARAALEPHVADGQPQARLLAISLLAPVAAERAMEELRRMMDDASAPKSFRDDAFQLMLLINTPSDRTKEVIAALSRDDLAQQRIAIRFLALGAEALTRLTQSSIYISTSMFDESFGLSSSSVRSGEAIVPTPPRGLQAEDVRPSLASPDAEVAALAGYLLTLLGEPDGLEPLLRYWRTQPKNQELDRLVYRAVAVCDDPRYIPVLREIFRRTKQQWDQQEFYWTIRIMGGPEILEFRKRLRREIGVGNLQ